MPYPINIYDPRETWTEREQKGTDEGNFIVTGGYGVSTESRRLHSRRDRREPFRRSYLRRRGADEHKVVYAGRRNIQDF